MTAFAQNFNTYAGDTISPIFKVTDQDGNPIGIGAAQNIVWQAARTAAGFAAPVVMKQLGQGITILGTGDTGMFQLNLTGVDTLPLSGVYLHEAIVYGSTDNAFTVTLGQMTVGSKPSWTYDATQLGTAPGTGNPLMQVRREIGDVNYGDQQIWDEEINFALGQRGYVAGQPSSGVIYGAAADSCRYIAANYSRQVDTVQGELKTNYSQRSKAYLMMAAKFDFQAAVAGPGTAYAGGISVSDKMQQQANTDRPSTAFAKGMTDNRWAGNEGPETPPFGGNSTDFGLLPDF